MSEALAYEDEPMEEAAPERQPRQPWVMSAIGQANLAFDIEDEVLNRIGSKVVEEYAIDMASREAEGYEERIKNAVKLASLLPEKKNTPWDNAANIKHPLLIEAAIQFNARAYPAIIDGPDVAKGSPKGKPATEKTARAGRIGKHLSYQLLEEEEEWEEDTDSLLLRQSIVGTLVRKRYFDPMLGRNCSHVLGPDEFVVNYKAKRDLSVVPRATHVLTFYPHEILEKQRSGLWLDVELSQGGADSNDDQSPHRFLEQHRLWDMDEDGYPEPYIITVHEETQKVVRITARWYEEGVSLNQKGEVARIKPYECFIKYGFIPSPDGGFYDVGYGTLLGSTGDTINTILNQLIDAGTLANLQGGWIGEGVSIKSGSNRFKPGEWKRASSTGGLLKDNIVPINYKEPSSVLFNLLVFLVEGAKGLTATQDILTGEAGKGTLPVGTVQALVEQGLKTFTAIVKRNHRSLKRELKIQYQLNARYLEEEVYVTFQDEPLQILRADYTEGDMDVAPCSDPNMATDLQRMTQAQFTLEVATGAGGDVRVAGLRALQAARVPDPEEIFPPPQGPPKEDPKIVVEKVKAHLKERELDIKEGATAADIAAKNATTEQTKLETMMMSADAQAIISQAVQMAIAQAMEMMHGGPAPMGPGGVPGMEAQPGNGPVPALAEGPAGPLGGPMGAGPGDEPFAAGQGAAVPGAIDPQLV
jgi:chaperonin GroES